jgi:hypothetical protein
MATPQLSMASPHVTTAQYVFHQQVADIMANVELAACSIADVQVYRDHCEHNHRMTIRTLELKESKRILLSKMKDALRDAINQSSRVYLVGVLCKAFETIADGFTCVLADVEDESMACREFLDMGKCCAWSCTKRHPTSMKRVVITVQKP